MIPQPLSRDLALADIRRRLNDLESSPNLYGAVITGSTMQTDTTDTGFKITTDGIRQYDSDTGEVTSSWTDDGIDLAGATLTGGDVTGAVVTGGIIRTDDSGPRVEIRPDMWFDSQVGLRFYDDTGNDAVPEIRSQNSTGSLTIISGKSSTGEVSELDLNGDNGDWLLGARDGTNDRVLFATATDLWIKSSGGAIVLWSENVRLSGTPTVTGQTANVYMDPTTGTLSRIT